MSSCLMCWLVGEDKTFASKSFLGMDIFKFGSVWRNMQFVDGGKKKHRTLLKIRSEAHCFGLFLLVESQLL